MCSGNFLFTFSLELYFLGKYLSLYKFYHHQALSSCDDSLLPSLRLKGLLRAPKRQQEGRECCPRLCSLPALSVSDGRRPPPCFIMGASLLSRELGRSLPQLPMLKLLWILASPSPDSRGALPLQLNFSLPDGPLGPAPVNLRCASGPWWSLYVPDQPFSGALTQELSIPAAWLSWPFMPVWLRHLWAIYF